MEVGSLVRIPVAEASQVGDARRQVARLAEQRGLGETVAGRVALVVTELAGNLVKHTPEGGELIVRPLDDAGLEVLALDRGPGMENVARCLQDGYSTAGSPGTGLGAVSRLADLFQVYSAPGQGTAILARVGASAEPDGPLEPGAVSLAKPGQEVCGDGWAVLRDGARASVLVVDGLGHGPGAASASQEAIHAFRRSAGRPLAETLDRMHDAMRGTRGGAVALASLDADAGEIVFLGVGNISGSILEPGGSRSTVSQNGIVGHEMKRVQEFTYAFPPGATLVLHSDGLSARWDAGRYPGLLARHPSLVAGVLYRDFGRGNDDATVVAVRRAGSAGGAGF